MRGKRVLASLLMSVVYIVPADIDVYKEKIDSTVDMVFNKMCSTTTRGIACDLSSVPSSLYNNVPLSKIRSVAINFSILLQGQDSVTFCSSYDPPTNCETFNIDDYTSFRIEVYPADQLDTYGAVPPNCGGSSTPAAVPLTYTPCRIGTASGNTFIVSGGRWYLNTSCFPSFMNVPVLFFCQSWSK